MQIIDESAAYTLLAAAVKQARKDLTRKVVRPENRVSAYMLFDTILEVTERANTDTGWASASPENRANVRATNRQVY